MPLTIEQSKGFDCILNWFTNKTSPTFILAGYAGVGKGYLIKYLVEYLKSGLKNIIVGTFTWKASLVLINRGVQSQSLHSIFYNVPDEKDETDSSNKINDLIFRPRTPRELVNKFGKLDLIIVDEASMVDTEMRTVILSHKIPVLFVGDSGQLPAINDNSPIMNNPNFLLTEIQRQALDSPIIRLSMDVREGRNIPYGTYGDKVAKIKKLPIEDINEKYLLKADMILCAKNDTRKDFNYYIRYLKKINSDKCPIDGERLVVLKNLPELQLFNGMLLKTYGSESYSVDLLDSVKRCFIFSKDVSFKNSKDLFMSNLAFEDNIRDLNKKLSQYTDPDQIKKIKSAHYKMLNKQRIPVVDFGYAMTVHKCQGSSFPKVFIYYEQLRNMDKDSAKRWLYTAVTRAEKALVLMQ